ncbi:MAG TPA: adenosylmethionine--8-amino-7-oxononanoate transaminase [Ferruginibacter sp.]|nr:adenosylmethionine--8-amino-7-oxononanoate transaminase [Ferruginibacter sp.]
MSQQLQSTDHIWHPFTQMKTADAPIQIVRAKDCALHALDGKIYIDAISSWWVNIHGHANEYIASAIAQQAQTLEQVIFAGFTHQPAIDLSKTLIRLLPSGFSKVFFSDDGSTSVEVAIKMAFQYWHNQGSTHKTKLIAFENAYHGDTFGAMSAGGRSTFNAAFQQQLFEVFHIPLPTKDNIEAVSAQFKKIAEQDTVAAFIFEPLVQGAAGMQMYEAAHLDKLIGLAKEHNILCIADEVMTGFGRTGTVFAIEQLEQSPDIICLSKGITGGFLPLGVTVSTQHIYVAFYADDVTKTFFHGHSYTANPLACAAANASMHLLQQESCKDQIRFIGLQHQSFAKNIALQPMVKSTRQTGTILAIELQTGEAGSYFNSIRQHAYRFYIDQGVLLRPLGNVVYIMPPYCITAAELQRVYDVIALSLDFLQQSGTTTA